MRQRLQRPSTWPATGSLLYTALRATTRLKIPSTKIRKTEEHWEWAHPFGNISDEERVWLLGGQLLPLLLRLQRRLDVQLQTNAQRMKSSLKECFHSLFLFFSGGKSSNYEILDRATRAWFFPIPGISNTCA